MISLISSKIRLAIGHPDFMTYDLFLNNFSVVSKIIFYLKGLGSWTQRISYWSRRKCSPLCF